MDWHIIEVADCDSTQDEVRARAAEGAPAGTAVVATTMGEGRGTHGRAWHAPEGGLYISLLLRESFDAGMLTMALGNAVADVLEVAGAEPRIKWVNDVLVDGKKIAGILVEAESTGDYIDHMIAGIGINVNGSAAAWPHPLNGSAITLEDVLGVDSCMPDLQSYLLEAIETWLHRLRQGQTHDVLVAWRARDALLGHRIGFDPDGDFCSKLVGVARGIDDDGRLLIEVDGEVQAHRTGSALLME